MLSVNEGNVYHTAVAFKQVEADLESRELLREVAEHIICDTGPSIVESYWHHYVPIGITGVYVLKQSSLTLHTWPEYKKLVIDITTCGQEVNVDKVLDYLKKRLCTESIIVSREVL